MSTLSRGDQIETDYFHLKAQEWAMEPEQARKIVEQALEVTLPPIIIARRKGWFELSDGRISNHNSSPGDKDYANWEECFKGEGLWTQNTYLIWSNEHEMWWKPFGGGYTPWIGSAGRYCRDEAIDICRQATMGWNGKGPLPEIMVLEKDTIEFADRWNQKKQGN